MKHLARFILGLVISFVLIEAPVITSHAQAGMISTADVVKDLTRAESHQRVADFVARKDVQERLTQLGITPEEAHQRLASLSESEVQKMSQDIENATVGGNITGILVLVLLVLLIIYFAKRI